MAITSEKAFIEKAKEGFRLEIAKQYARSYYYLTNYKDCEITVSKSIIDKLTKKGIIDSNWDIHLNAL
jgi:hypothetical protein